jgi:hypothetical protein
LVQVLLGIAGFVTITSILMIPRGAFGWADFSVWTRIAAVLTLALGVVCIAAAFDDWTRFRLLPAAAGIWLLYDAAKQLRFGERMTWSERLPAIRDLRPVKPVVETAPAFIGARGHFVDGPNPEVVRAELGRRGFSPKIEEVKPGWFAGGDEEFTRWLKTYDRNTRTFTVRKAGLRTSGRQLWETVVPSPIRALLELLAGTCLLLALVPSPVQADATTIRDHALNGFATALFALGLVILLLQLSARRYAAFVGYGVLYGVLFLVARVAGWTPLD